MDHKIQWEVEGGDCRDHTQRHPDEETPALLRPGCRIQRDGFAMNPLGFLGSKPQGLDRPVHLESGELCRLTGLSDNGGGELFAVLSQEVGRPLQD